jgi:hypothetical protein
MKLGNAIADIMKREGFDILCAYRVKHLIEHAAAETASLRMSLRTFNKYASSGVTFQPSKQKDGS